MRERQAFSSLVIWKTESMLSAAPFPYLMAFFLIFGENNFFYISSWTSSRLYSPFWFLWHMDAPHLTNIVFLLIILLSTWGLDQIAVDSHSLIFCSCLHGSFNLLKRGNDNNIFNDTSATVIFILTVVGWFLIWYVIRKKSINK